MADNLQNKYTLRICNTSFYTAKNGYMNASRCHICTYIASLAFILVLLLFMQSALILSLPQTVFVLRFSPRKVVCVCVFVFLCVCVCVCAHVCAEVLPCLLHGQLAWL